MTLKDMVILYLGDMARDCDDKERKKKIRELLKIVMEEDEIHYSDLCIKMTIGLNVGNKCRVEKR